MEEVIITLSITSMYVREIFVSLPVLILLNLLKFAVFPQVIFQRALRISETINLMQTINYSVISNINLVSANTKLKRIASNDPV